MIIPTKIQARYKQCVRLRQDPWCKLQFKHFRRIKWRKTGLIRRSVRKVRRFSQFALIYTLLKRRQQHLRYRTQRNLLSKQCWKHFYGSIQDFKVKRLVKRSSDWKAFFLQQESRLDVLLFRCHLFYTISEARQWINHGHVKVNGKKTNTMYLLKKGDIIELNEKLKVKLKGYFSDFRRSKTRKYRIRFTEIHKPVPNWVDFDSQSFRIFIVSTPSILEINYPFRINAQNLFAIYKN